MNRFGLPKDQLKLKYQIYEMRYQKNQEPAHKDLAK